MAKMDWASQRQKVLSQNVANADTPDYREKDLKKLFPREEWGRRHLQLIYFGREYCPARGHEKKECPICSWAATRRREGLRPARGEKVARSAG